jgi:hypothetical protein
MVKIISYEAPNYAVSSSHLLGYLLCLCSEYSLQYTHLTFRPSRKVRYQTYEGVVSL